MINVGARPGNLDELLKAHLPQLARSPHELKIRSRPLLESNSAYVSEVVPSWAPTAQLAQPQGDAGNSKAAGALQAGAKVGKDAALDSLRSALRSEEERKVDREARLRNLGVNFLRPMPGQVRAPMTARCNGALTRAEPWYCFEFHTVHRHMAL